MTGTTPVPNVLFDYYLNGLKESEIKLLLVINRQTLGWESRRSLHGRKERDWISSSQFVEKTGCSRRAISSAIETLVNKLLIRVYDDGGNLLHHSSERKGKSRLFFCLAPALLMPVDNRGIKPALPVNTALPCANNAEGLRKNRGYAQHLDFF